MSNTDEHGNLIHSVTTELTRYHDIYVGQRLYNAVTGLNYMESPVVTNVRYIGMDVEVTVDANGAHALEELVTVGGYNSLLTTIDRTIG